MPSTLLFAINTEGRVFGLSTNGTKWREFIYLGLEFKQLSAVPHFLWAIGGDRQVYVHVHGLDIPIRVKEEAYENERWTPFDGFSKRLLPTDRYQFSNQDGTKDRTLKKIKLPSMAWQWEGDWHLEMTFDGQSLDEDGWTYAVDFPGTYYAKKQWSSCVRRRKWIRYRKYSALNSWCAIAPLHKDPTREPFIGVAVGGNEIPGGKPGIMLVWAVTAHGRVMFRTEVSNVSPEGQRWSSITTPSGCEVSQISVGPTGLVWAVLWSGKALVRTGITRDCLTGESWEEVDQPGENLLLSQVSVGYNGLWAITRDNRVWFRKGIKGDNCGVSVELAKGSGWVEMIGNMSCISVAPNDQVWAVGAEDRLLYFRTAVTQDDLTGKTWRLIGAPTQLSRTSSSASLFSTSQSGGTPREKRHRSWTSLNRHSGSHESQPRTDFDLNETCHSAPAVSRNVWQKSTDGTSVQSYGSHQSSDSGSYMSSLPESSNNLDDLPHPSDIIEERTKEEEKENNAYEDTSHPVVGFSSKEIACWNGIVLAITSEGSLVCKPPNEENFRSISTPKPVIINIALGPDHIAWIVDDVNTIYFSDDFLGEEPHWWQIIISDYMFQNSSSLLQNIQTKLESYSINEHMKQTMIACNEDSVWVYDTVSTTLRVNKAAVTGYIWEEIALAVTLPFVKWQSISANSVFETGGLLWLQSNCGDLFSFLLNSKNSPVLKAVPVPSQDTRCISSSAGVLWLLSTDGHIYARLGLNCKYSVGSSWKELTTDNVRLTWMSCGRALAWGCDFSGKVCATTESPYQITSKLFDSKWVRVEGHPEEVAQFEKVFVGPNFCMVWAIDNKQNVYFRDGISPHIQTGTNWILVAGIQASMITISKTSVWALSPKGTVYRRYGVTETNYMGDYWKGIPGSLWSVASTFGDELWGIDQNNKILRLKRKTKIFAAKKAFNAEESLDSVSLNESENGWEIPKKFNWPMA